MPKGVYKRKAFTGEHKKHMRKAAIKGWQTHEYRRNHMKAQKGKTGVYVRTEEHNKITSKAMNRSEVKKKLRIAMIEIYNRPEVKKKHKEIMNSPEVKKKSRQAAIKMWKDPEFVKKQMKSRSIKPNKAELNLNKFLHRILPNEYKFVGDGEFILAGKCPDFVNVNGQKKIIELYGNYWHKGETGQKRITLFRQYGYETLIIWENELEDEVALKGKILNFNGEQNDK